MKRIPFLFLIVFLFSCSKENPEEIITTVLDDGTEINSIGEGDCQLRFANGATILETSLEVMNYNDPSETVLYKDADEQTYTYDINKEFNELVCLHEWVCPSDNEIAISYWANRPLHRKKFSSDSNPFSFEIDHYASLNETTPIVYGDVLTINFNIVGAQGEEHNCTAFTYVIDARNDASLSNEGLNYFESITINGVEHEKVYQQEDERFTVYFSVEDGLVGYEDKQTGDSLTLLSN